MADLSTTRIEELQKAYVNAQNSPLIAASKIGLSSTSSRIEVTSIFTKVCLFKSGSALESEWGIKTLNDAIVLFLTQQKIPSFVARFVAGIDIGEIDPKKVLGEAKSPP